MSFKTQLRDADPGPVLWRVYRPGPHRRLQHCRGLVPRRDVDIADEVRRRYAEMDDVSDSVLQFTEANRRWVAAPAEGTTLGRESFTQPA